MKTLTLLKIPSGWGDDEHQQAFERIVADGLDGLEASIFGGTYGPIWSPNVEWDLDFLKHYSSVSTLRVGLRFRSLAPLSAVAHSLTRLDLMDPGGKSNPSDLSPVADCTHLVSLSSALPGKDLSPITRLLGLKEIALTGGWQDRVAILTALPNLRTVYLGFGSVESLAGLEKLTSLQRFTAFRLNRISNLEPLGNCQAISIVELDKLSNVVALPSFRENEHLHTMICRAMTRLKNLDGLKGSAVRDLAVISCNVSPEAVGRIAHSITKLEQVVLRLGRVRDTEEAAHYFDHTVLKKTTDDFEEYYRDYVRIKYVS